MQVMSDQIVVAIIGVFGTLIGTVIVNHRSRVRSFIQKSTGLLRTALPMVIILLLSGCGIANSQTSTIQPSPVPSIPQIKIEKSNASPEKRIISKESLPQQNCGGSSSVTNEQERSHTIQFTLDVKGGITVSGGGEAEIPGVGKVNVGVAVAGEYGVGYGESTSMSRKLSVSAREGTSVIHDIQQVEYWQTGNINVLIDGKVTASYPYQFRTDFGFELVGTQPQPCPTQVLPSIEPSTAQPTRILPTFEPTQVETPTSVVQVSAETPSVGIVTPTTIVTATAIATNTTSTPAKPAAIAFKDSFDVSLRTEWHVIQEGLAINQGKLTGESNQGLILYNPQAADYTIKLQVAGQNYAVYFRATEKNSKVEQGYAIRCETRKCHWLRVDDGNAVELSSWQSSEVLLDGKTHTLKIEVQGSTFTAYVDDDPFTSVTDAHYTSGEVGLTSVYTGASYTVYFDSFELAPVTTPTAQTNNTLNGDFLDTFDVASRSEWRTAQEGLAVWDGRLMGESNQGLILYNPQAADYTIKLQVAGQNYAVYFRATEKNSKVEQGYAIRCETRKCHWLRVDDGNAVELSSWQSSEVLLDGKTHTLKIEVQGSTFTAYVDEDPFTSVTDAHYTSGEVGLTSVYTGASYTVYFNSFEITPVTTPTARTNNTPNGDFLDTFDVASRSEWRTAQEGLAVWDGRLMGESNQGLILYNPQAADYTIKLQVAGQNYAVYFRATEKNSKVEQGYAIRCETRKCHWLRVDDGNAVELSSWQSSEVLLDGKTHTLKIEVQGSTFTAYVDEDPFTSVTDAHYTSGEVGLTSVYTGASYTVYFDSFELVIQK